MMDYARISGIAKVYGNLIMKGIKTLNEVPTPMRSQAKLYCEQKGYTFDEQGNCYDPDGNLVKVIVEE